MQWEKISSKIKNGSYNTYDKCAVCFLIVLEFLGYEQICEFELSAIKETFITEFK
jgi:hypothetical protein